MKLVDLDYENKKDKELTQLFINSKDTKKYILGINKFEKAVIKHIHVDGIIDDFTRVQSSKKKDILKIEDIPKENSIILSASTGSPLEVKNKLDELGYKNFNYLSFYYYSGFQLPSPIFMGDFKDDFSKNKDKYKKTYELLKDEKSKRIFEKVINFKISYDLEFMKGFTNDHENQYFDKEIIPHIKNISFLDGGAYVGDTLEYILKNYPDYKKIYCIEPSLLHINIAKRENPNLKNVEFINCGLGNKTQLIEDNLQEPQNNCRHDYQTQNINTVDKLIKEKIDFIKLDIEGDEIKALEGAKNTIKEYQPILAICIYHKASDWYEVPNLVLSIRNDYDIYLRHYMEGIYETVMYFIPKI
ncbi:FkbM family methyltransferase [Arcobacter sp. YIC-80]|uniref:FkbM family methyltransferase n=1 Tax=Arcobacter sp. YIC-80 TaxID=3376683 RepID=UPI00384DCC7F